jgi:hypothetical protein
MAKEGLEGHATVIDEDNPRRSEFRKHFALEGLFAFSLWSVKDMERLLSQVVVYKTEHEEMMKLLEKLHSFLMEGKMYFGNGVKQQLLTVFICQFKSGRSVSLSSSFCVGISTLFFRNP